MATLHDDSLMPFGKHKGKEMANVPAKDLLWLYDNGLEPGNVKKYIFDNLDVLRKKVENEND